MTSTALHNLEAAGVVLLAVFLWSALLVWLTGHLDDRKGS